MNPAQGLSIPDYFTKYTAANGHGPVNTASGSFNDIANSIFHTAAAVSLIVTLFLDNTIPGTEVPCSITLYHNPNLLNLNRHQE